jgi:hypothetical protein
MRSGAGSARQVMARAALCWSLLTLVLFAAPASAADEGAFGELGWRPSAGAYLTASEKARLEYAVTAAATHDINAPRAVIARKAALLDACIRNAAPRQKHKPLADVARACLTAME